MPPRKRKSKASISQARKVRSEDIGSLSHLLTGIQKRKAVEVDGETDDVVTFQHERTQNDKPCYDAFGTTEILEGILECLPAAEIHIIQRVNKRFQNVIVNSPRIQRRLFLRIDDKPGAPWTFRQPIEGWIIKVWCLSRANGVDSDSEDLLTEVKMNPCLHVSEGYRKLVSVDFCSNSKEILRRGPLVRLPFGRTSTLQQIGQQTWQQDSISRSFISDPHCHTIGIMLCFTLGVRRPTIIHVISAIESDTPLTIGTIISKALDTRGVIKIKWRGDGYTAAEAYDWREGVPRDLMNGLKSRSGLEVYFRPKDTMFLLNGTVALTDEEEAAIESRQSTGSEIKIRL